MVRSRLAQMRLARFTLDAGAEQLALAAHMVDEIEAARCQGQPASGLIALAPADRQTAMQRLPKCSAC